MHSFLEPFEVLLFPAGESSEASIWDFSQENADTRRNSRHEQNRDTSSCYDSVRVCKWKGHLAALCIFQCCWNVCFSTQLFFPTFDGTGELQVAWIKAFSMREIASPLIVLMESSEPM